MRENVIVAEALSFAFAHEYPVLNNVAISISDEVVAITGASGSGKTTLLLCLAGILVPSSGKITINGNVLHSANSEERSRIRRENLGLVFQNNELVAELSLLENTALPLELLGQSRKIARREAHDLLGELGVGEIADRYPAQVSGGQAQRAAVARALVHRPAAVLADEPTGALDAANSEKVLQLLITAARQRAVAVVLVTHDQTVAAHADRTIDCSTLSTAPASTVETSTPEAKAKPPSLRRDSRLTQQDMSATTDAK